MDKYKEIYQNYPAYKCLSERTKELFDLLFKPLYLDETVTYTNQFLADTTNEGLSSIEKHMKELRDNKLISCKTSKYFHFGSWKTTRIISFNPFFITSLEFDLKEKMKKNKEVNECLF